MVAEVLVELKAKRIDKTFTYAIPEEMRGQVKVGIRVLVPFGRQTVEGFVLKVAPKEEVEYALKDIKAIVDENPVLNEELLALGKYISKKTFSSLISAYQNMLPTALKAHHKINISKKYETYLILIEQDFIPKTKAQEKVLNLLKEKKLVKKEEANQISISATKTLLEKKVIAEKKEETYRLKNEIQKENNHIELTEEQIKAVTAITQKQNTFQPFLLHGVTGSGKTEVYMQVIEQVLLQKKEVIVLVPEISLTPQLVSQFKKRFQESIAILHSRLSDGEKYDEWRKIERKEVSIVIGARSAIFAPFTNLGLIIIDEEHTTSYKQENNPRYHAIDVALKRARTHQCPLVLGSATPTMESYTRAKAGIYQLLTMKKRVNDTMPEITCIDMKDEIKHGNRIISQRLKEKIIDRLEKKEQIILLLNRRGYSTVLTCKECGFTLKCPNCDIPLTFHKQKNALKCHYCNYTAPLSTKCPECKKGELTQYGMGTEKLEQIIKEMFKDIRTLRMDVDTTGKKNAHEKMIRAFQEKEYDMLIGTQMIAKGLDFPNVTLVGVIHGDTSLNIPDFRSAERTFQLLSQVSGRAGRGEKKGEVIIQGFNMEHYSIISATYHDYDAFYQQEMHLRATLNYPPFCSLALIRIISKEENKALTEANKISKFLKQKTKVQILGPSMSSIPKVNNQYYIQVLIKYKKLEEIFEPLEYLYQHYQKEDKVSVEIDVNPLIL